MLMTDDVLNVQVVQIFKTYFFNVAKICPDRLRFQEIIIRLQNKRMTN